MEFSSVDLTFFLLYIHSPPPLLPYLLFAIFVFKGGKNYSAAIGSFYKDN
ncbi:unnamed protein product [Phytomonas sp. Hart1]|nr:unnamed protein product [Phytomonas sp. Hart1]|eukprot:CCW70742.1 unnamed protein product [Phytomonas sp. isolate Hart1]